MSKAFTPLMRDIKYSDDEMKIRANDYYTLLKSRRTVRDYDSKPVPREVIDACIQTAGTAPSGATQQPWHFVVVRDASIKMQIREAAEEEERLFYEGRAGDTWLDTLKPLGTNEEKPFLEKAPVLIAIFEQKYSLDDSGTRVKHYYAKESVGIASGMLITALHQAGLATLTHTPSPMNFLSKILKRPEGEKPFLLLVVGHPAVGTLVPDITKKRLDKIRTEI